MTFEETLVQISDVLQQEQRVSYRALKVRFQLDDDLMETVKDELIYAKNWLWMRIIGSLSGLVRQDQPQPRQPQSLLQSQTTSLHQFLTPRPISRRRSLPLAAPWKANANR